MYGLVVGILENVSLKVVSDVTSLVNVALKGVSLRPGGRNPRKSQLEGRKRSHIRRQGQFKGGKLTAWLSESPSHPDVPNYQF